MKEPLKLTLQMDAEQAPPIRTICQFLYLCLRRMRSSRLTEASLTDTMS